MHKLVSEHCSVWQKKTLTDQRLGPAARAVPAEPAPSSGQETLLPTKSLRFTQESSETRIVGDEFMGSSSGMSAQEPITRCFCGVPRLPS